MELKTFMLIICILILIGGCSGGTGLAVHKDTVKIGIDFPMSGPLAVYGNPLFEGFQLAAEEINQEGGINGRPIQLVVQDNRGTPKEAVTAAEQMLDNDKIDLMLTTLVGPAGAIAPLTESRKKILLYAAAADNFAESNQYVFKDSVDSYNDCRLLAEYGAENGIKRIALFGADAEFTEKCKEGMNSVKGVEMVSFEKYVKGDMDFATPLTKIGSKNPDAIYLLAYSDDCINIWKKAKELDLSTTYMVPITQSGCGDEGSMKSMAGIRNNVIGLDFVVDKAGERFTKFSSDFKSRYSKEPSMLFFTALGYDWGHYVASAMASCRDASDTECVKAALEKTDYDGIWGHVSFSPKHTTLRPRELIQFSEDKWAKLQ